MSLDQYRTQGKLRGDSTLLLLVLGLSLFGLLMISSASVVISYEKFGSNTVYLSRQAVYFVMGTIALITTSLIDYKLWRTYAKIFLGVSLFLLFLVEIPGIGINLGGAQRWIRLGPILIQPSEIIKISFIIYAAAWLEKRETSLQSFKRGVIPFFILLAVVCLLIIRQPDLGTTLVVAATALVMLYVTGVALSHLLLSGVFGLGVVFLLIRTSHYRWERFLTFLNPKLDIQGAGYQINQALLAIGSGGWFGLGFGMSRQKYLYLPVAQTDAIFAVMVEELGFLRVLILIIVFAFLGLRGYAIAKNAPDIFSKALASGITTWILFQAFVNIGGVMGVIPLTGIPLPFISYGGSSLIALLASTGILYNISRHTHQESIR